MEIHEESRKVTNMIFFKKREKPNKSGEEGLKISEHSDYMAYE